MRQEQEKQTRVALIDDDELVLSSLSALFEHQAGYHVVTYGDPLRAVEELGRLPVDIVISDYLMPELNGIDLLTKVRRLQPDTARILLTGFADKQNAIRAINEAGLYQFLEKPWDNDQLLMVIGGALQQKSLRRQLAEKVRALDRLVKEHTELAERQRSLERDLEMAAHVQRSLLPRCFPAVAGLQIDSFYRPCRAIGGDYFDFIKRDGETWILVSDISGHGAQAALSSMLIKAIFHEVGAATEGPAQLFAEMNAKLNRFLPAGIYAATAAVCVDERNGTIRLVNAGLPFPFVLRAGDGRLDQILLPGFPLGMFSGVGLERYEVRQIEMTPGDVLLVASDGLSETQAENGEVFGDLELRRTLNELNGSRGSEVIERLIESADQFSRSRKPEDDVAIVALTRTST